MEHMDKTEGEKGLLFRLTICCNAITIWEATRMVSMVWCGAAACPPLPLNVIYNSSALAITLPPRKLSFPFSSCGFTCMPTMSSGVGFSSTPSRIIILAPPGFLSSPGWKISLTVPFPFLPCFLQDPCCTQQAAGMHIMSAGMHDAVFSSNGMEAHFVPVWEVRPGRPAMPRSGKQGCCLQ